MLQAKDIKWLNGFKKKKDTYICCLQETHFRSKDTHRLKVRGLKKVLHANGKQKKVGVPIFISDKIDFKTKIVTRDKEEHYIMIKGSIPQEDITIVSIYVPNIGAPKYLWQILTNIKGEIDSYTIIVGDFNTLLTSMDRSSRWNINKETLALNDALDKMDLIDIYIEHSIQRQNTVFSRAHTWNILQDRSNARPQNKSQ